MLVGALQLVHLLFGPDARAANPRALLAASVGAADRAIAAPRWSEMVSVSTRYQVP